MALPNSLRTVELAHAGGISVEPVRNYEALGLLPLADQAVKPRVRELGRQGMQPASSLVKEPTRERVPAFLG